MSIQIKSRREVVYTVLFLLSTLSKSALAQQQRSLIWSDEFNSQGRSSPNPNYWSYDTGNGGWGNGELQRYTITKSNAVVEDGKLKIIARKDERTSPPTFTSARIKTQDKISFKYGTLEARIKVPNVEAGLWPAFWTMGSNVADVGWPKSGEVDIMEVGQGVAIKEGLVNQRVVSAAHWDYKGNYATYAKWYDFPTNLNNDFHIYRLEWTPKSMSTFVDDSLIWSMSISPEDCADCEELHQHHFILLNMAIGGGFTSGGSSSSGGGGSSSSSGCGQSSGAGGSSSSSGGCSTRGPNDITATMPGELAVDWVRLYDNGHTDASPIPRTPTPPPTPAPTRRPTQPVIRSTPSPTPLPTAKPTQPLRTTPRPTPGPTHRPTPYPVQPSYDDSDDSDDDCFPVSRSSSGGKSGKGGKGGKGGASRRSEARSRGGKGGKGGKGGGASRRSEARSRGMSKSKSKGGRSGARSGCRCASERSGNRSGGGKAGKGGKGGKGSNRQLKGKGKGKGRSDSASQRSGCGSGRSGGGEGRVSTLTSHLSAESAMPSRGVTTHPAGVHISACFSVLLGLLVGLW